MQMGFLGIIIYSLIIVKIINLISIFDKVPRWFINSIILIPMLYAFIGSDLPITLLTHGLLIGFMMLYLYNSSENHLISIGKKRIKI